MTTTDPVLPASEQIPVDPIVSVVTHYVDIKAVRGPAIVTGAGLAMALFSDLMFNGHEPGISVPIFFSVFVLGLLALALYEGQDLHTHNLWLIAPILALAALFVLRDAPLLRFLNFAGAAILSMLLLDRLRGGPISRFNLRELATSMILTGAWASVLGFALAGRAALELGKRSDSDKSTARRVLIGVLLALPLLLVFTGLFASADLLFSKLLGDVLEAFKLERLLSHFIITGVLAWMICGSLAYALARQPGAAEDSSESDADRWKLRILGGIESTVILGLINLLFIAFIAVQAAALFGGEAFLRAQGLTYSAYARRGFFELVAVAVIVLSLILALDFFTARGSARGKVVFAVGTGLMISLTIVMLGSAFYRMNLYELAYGFTRLRLHTHVFMVWLGLLLSTLEVMIIIGQTRRFALALITFCIGFTLTLNILNPDAFIARQNIARARAGLGELDTDYLGNLSADALPLTVPLLDHPDYVVRGGIGAWLHYQLDGFDRTNDRAGWPSYHWSLSRGAALLDSRRAEIESYTLPDYWYSLRE